MCQSKINSNPIVVQNQLVNHLFAMRSSKEPPNKPRPSPTDVRSDARSSHHVCCVVYVNVNTEVKWGCGARVGVAYREAWSGWWRENLAVFEPHVRTTLLPVNRETHLYKHSRNYSTAAPCQLKLSAAKRFPRKFNSVFLII